MNIQESGLTATVCDVDEVLVGVISDTHGLLRTDIFDLFAEVTLIMHAGDVGSEEVLRGLRSIAPVVAVRGNTDRGVWADSLPLSETREVGGVLAHILHDLEDLDLDPAAAGIGLVISGHSHRPHIAAHRNVFYLNPGSAGPRRFSLPITAAIVRIKGAAVTPRIIHLT